MGIFSRLFKTSKEDSTTNRDESRRSTDTASQSTSRQRVVDMLEDIQLSVQRSRRQDDRLDKAIVDLKKYVDALDDVKVQHSNLKFLSDLVYIKSSKNVLITKARNLKTFRNYDETILDDLIDAMSQLSTFARDLKQYVVDHETRMIESIIDATLKERSNYHDD